MNENYSQGMDAIIKDGIGLWKRRDIVVREGGHNDFGGNNDFQIYSK